MKYFFCWVTLIVAIFNSSLLMAKTEINPFSSCNYFTSSVQTWDSNGRLEVSGRAVIENAYNGKYVGFKNNNKLTVTSSSCRLDESSIVEECLADSSLMIPEYPWRDFPLDMSPSYTIDNGDMILYPGNYSLLPQDTGHTSGKYIFNPGDYWIENISLSGDQNLSFPIEKVTLNVSSISISGNVVINNQGNPDDLLIVAHTTNGNIALSSNNEVNSLIISRNGVTLSGNTIIRGAVSSNNVTMAGNAKIIGQSSCFDPPSKDYTLKVTPKIDYSLTCERIPVTFTVEDDNGPVSGFNKSFSALINAKDNGAACWSRSADKSVAADCGITGSIFVDGEQTLYLDSSDLGVFDVTASSDGLNEVIKEHFEFVPFKFNADTVRVIANESQKFDVKALACRNDISTVVTDYHGSKTLKASNYTLDYPKSSEQGVISTILKLKGEAILKLKGEANSPKDPLQVDLIFNNGVAQIWLTYPESGAIHFILSDPLFTCPSDFDCDNYPVDSGILSGLINVESRPWKLAVCSDLAVDGNSTNGSAFVAAGEKFSLKVKPVQYSSTPNPDLCQLPITQNFFASKAPKATITALDPTLDSPASGGIGTLSSLPSFENNKHKGSGTESYYSFEDMTYDEVGSIQFNVEASSPTFYDSIQDGIDEGVKSVGRFFPAYFTITGTEWNYPAKQGSFVYMDQFFDTKFEVTAYSSGGELTENYGLFSDGLKASFSLVDLSSGDHSERLNISDDDLDDENWSDAVWTTPNFSDGVLWSRKGASALAGNTTTEADGPFNMSGNSNSVTTALGLKISGVDPVSFDATSFAPIEINIEQELLSQPDVRYGRMVLDSVGTAVGQSVTIPLRVEYWNGNSFVISDTDNATTFNGAHYCKQTIWPESSSASNSALSGDNLGGIDSGVDRHNLKATANTNNSALREQVRFWLRLASTPPQTREMNVDCESGHVEQPWLQYNWRGLGDEDPSTVVTFGIYRGNDRVIFRGESNIIGTSN